MTEAKNPAHPLSRPLRRAVFWLAAAAVAAAFAFPAAVFGQGLASDEAEQGPPMGALFFTAEERRILEAIRQGVVEEEELEFTEDILPVVVIQEALPDEDEIQERSGPLQVDWLIVRRSTGDAVVRIGNKEYRTDEEAQDGVLGGLQLQRQGVVIERGDINGNILRGVDTFNNRRFELKIGQILGANGQLNEGDSYPVVIRKTPGENQ